MNIEKTITDEELRLLPIDQFNGPVVVIDSVEHGKAAVNQLITQPVLGFDTETKPSFKKGEINKVALLQLSTPDVAYLFRINRTGLFPALVQLLEHPQILKVGVAVRDDLRALQKRTPFTPSGFIEIQDVAHDLGYKDSSLKKLAGVLLGIRISKRQRLTNWDAEELTSSQIVYAATDAWVSLQIHNHLTSRN